MQGNFDGPVDTAEPRLLPMRLERLQVQDQPAYTIKIDAAGRAMITIAGRRSERHELSIQQRDTVRMLLARIIEKPVVPCTSTAYYRLQVDTATRGLWSGLRLSAAATGVPCIDRATRRPHSTSDHCTAGSWVAAH